MLSQFIARIRASPGLAVLMVVAAGAVYAFAELVDEVLEGESRAFDEWILQALRTPGDPGDPIGPWWLETVFVDITALGGNTVVILITLAALGYLVIDGKRAAALLVPLAGGLTNRPDHAEISNRRAAGLRGTLENSDVVATFGCRPRVG